MTKFDYDKAIELIPLDPTGHDEIFYVLIKGNIEEQIDLICLKMKDLDFVTKLQDGNLNISTKKVFKYLCESVINNVTKENIYSLKKFNGVSLPVIRRLNTEFNMSIMLMLKLQSL